MYEISGKLRKAYPKDYKTFKKAITDVYNVYLDLFGLDIMNRVDFFVDNALTGSGHTPTCVPILEKYVLIKLHIADFNDYNKVVYQFAHELCHLVFYSMCGLDNQLDIYEEDSIASAMSLVMLYHFKSDEVATYMKNTLGYAGAYGNGVNVALEEDYDLNNMKKRIINFANKYNIEHNGYTYVYK